MGGHTDKLASSAISFKLGKAQDAIRRWNACIVDLSEEFRHSIASGQVLGIVTLYFDYELDNIDLKIVNKILNKHGFEPQK